MIPPHVWAIYRQVGSPNCDPGMMTGGDGLKVQTEGYTAPSLDEEIYLLKVLRPLWNLLGRRKGASV